MGRIELNGSDEASRTILIKTGSAFFLELPSDEQGMLSFQADCFLVGKDGEDVMSYSGIFPVTYLNENKRIALTGSCKKAVTYGPNVEEQLIIEHSLIESELRQDLRISCKLFGRTMNEIASKTVDIRIAHDQGD